MADLHPMTEREMLEHASRALGRIDRDGDRGVTMVTKEEIWAMALLLVRLGLVATQPGAVVPKVLVLGRDDDWDGSGRCPDCQGWDCDPDAGCVHDH